MPGPELRACSSRASSRCDVPSPLVWPPCSMWSWLLANLTAPLLAAHPGRAERPCAGSPLGPATQAVRAARTGPLPGTSGPGDLPKVARIRSRPACWAIGEGQVSGPVSNKMSGGPARNPIGVFVLEDQEIVRRGVRVLLEAEPDIQVIGEASTASSALAQIPALRPAVAVLDVRLPDGDGVSVCREVRSRAPEVACLMLTAFSDDEALLDSIMAGAAGYVLKQIRGSRSGRRGPHGRLRSVAAGSSRGEQGDGQAAGPGE